MEHGRNHAAGVKPLAPHEVVAEKKRLIPEEVLTVVNKYLGERAVKGYARIDQEEIVRDLVKAGIRRSDIFAHHWLDFEEIYREVGWEVEYDKPVRWGGDTYDPHFKFRAARGNTVY